MLGQTRLSAGAQTTPRILVRDRITGAPIRDAHVSIELRSPKRTISLGHCRTDTSGTVSQPFRLPDAAPGNYEMVVKTRSRAGVDQVVRQVEVYRAVRLYLSSDKPVYQPGQTIRMRTYTADTWSGKPQAGTGLGMEVLDPKGNKVFYRRCKASRFGIAAADFRLAHEVNLGRYEIRATVGAVQTTRTVEVKRYTLPAFRVETVLDKSYYLPGETVNGTVRAVYFFGLPTAEANVRIHAQIRPEQEVRIPPVQSVCDAEGTSRFSLSIPSGLTGSGLSTEGAQLQLTAEVTDRGGRVVRKVSWVPVADRHLVLAAFPEGGELVPGVENRVFILTTYPDGRAAVCELRTEGGVRQTDASGFCEIRVTPQGEDYALRLRAVDPAGKQAESVLKARSSSLVPPLLARTAKPVYKPGEVMRVHVLSTERTGTVFLDLIRQGQTVLTRSLSLDHGQAELSMPLTADMTGLLCLHTYLISSAGEDRGITRLVYVTPEADLKITSRLDRAVYRPGQTATMALRLTDAQGRPRAGAIGICVADEKVFHLGEAMPGLLRQFHDAQQETLRPEGQIRFSADPSQLLADTAARPGMAAALLASASGPRQVSLDDLARQGYISTDLVDRLRGGLDRQDGESLRNDPRFADAFRVLDRRASLYSFTARTGPAKQQEAQQFRRRYFRRLVAGMVTAASLAVALLLVAIVTRELRRIARRRHVLSEHMSDSERGLLQLGRYLKGVCVALYLSHYAAYVAALALTENLRLWRHKPTVLGLTVLFNTLLVLGADALMTARIRRALESGLGQAAKLLIFPHGYLAQYVVTRVLVGILFGLCQSGALRDGWSAAAWLVMVLLIVFMPLVMIKVGEGRLGRLIESRTAPASWLSRLLDVLVILVILAVLAGMMLPALSQAREKAHRINCAGNLKQLGLALRMAQEDGVRPGKAGRTKAETQPRVRRHFPETLFWLPELVTDDRGHAMVEIPLADSITSWRATIDAVSAQGSIGAVQTPIRVFQDFFIEPDIPVSLTLHDELSLPIVCHNHLDRQQQVHVELQAAHWFLPLASALARDVTLAPKEVRAVHFPIRVTQVGTHTLTVSAHSAAVSDAVEAAVEVVPNGNCVTRTEAGMLRGTHEAQFVFPDHAVPGASKLLVKLYPSRFSAVIEGLDAVFRKPNGCFEQTSSTTYPNVLVLDYLRRTGKTSPELEVKAREYIDLGYQRLLTFEVPGGGFEWFGHPPAHNILTAYGLLEFSDMARVRQVDPRLIARTRDWLCAQQQADGSWQPTSGGIAEGAINRHRGRTVNGTAYIAWALAEAGDRSQALGQALGYLRQHMDELATDYARAMAANAFLSANTTDPDGLRLLDELRSNSRSGPQDTVFWGSHGAGVTLSRGASLDIETTALAALALMNANVDIPRAHGALQWLGSAKSPTGGWCTTQATVLAVRALVHGAGTAAPADAASVVRVELNGATVERINIAPESSDVLRLISLDQRVRSGANRLVLRQEPETGIAYQVIAKYWLAQAPRAQRSAEPHDALEIETRYERDRLTVGEKLNCRVSVLNHTGRVIQMAIVDLGIPAGFDADTGALDALTHKGAIAKYDLTPKQAILYLRDLPAPGPLEFTWTLRPKYPLRVRTPPAQAYEYYAPENRAVGGTQVLEVKP